MAVNVLTNDSSGAESEVEFSKTDVGANGVVSLQRTIGRDRMNSSQQQTSEGQQQE